MKNLLTDEENGEENRKIMKCRYYWWKNLLTWMKNKEGKTEKDREKRELFEEETWMIRDLVRIRCCVVLQKLNCHHVGCPALSALRRQISGYPSASDSRTVLTQISLYHLFFVASFGAFSYWARFSARPVGRPHFRFVKSWIVGLAMGGAKSKGTDVAVGFFG